MEPTPEDQLLRARRLFDGWLAAHSRTPASTEKGIERAMKVAGSNRRELVKFFKANPVFNAFSVSKVDTKYLTLGAGASIRGFTVKTVLTMRPGGALPNSLQRGFDRKLHTRLMIDSSSMVLGSPNVSVFVDVLKSGIVKMVIHVRTPCPLFVGRGSAKLAVARLWQGVASSLPIPGYKGRFLI